MGVAAFLSYGANPGPGQSLLNHKLVIWELLIVVPKLPCFVMAFFKPMIYIWCE